MFPIKNNYDNVLTFEVKYTFCLFYLILVYGTGLYKIKGSAAETVK